MRETGAVMASNNEKKNEKKLLKRVEARADKRTAKYLAARFETIEGALADTVAELQSLGDYAQIAQVSYCLQVAEMLRKRYEDKADR